MPISVAEQKWFQSFMKQVEPRFQPLSRMAVSLKVDILYEEWKRSLLSDIARSNVDKSSVTLDFWTACDTRILFGCTVNYIHKEKLKSHILFLLRFHILTRQNI